MENDIRQLKKRFVELYDRAETRGYAVYSDFLTLSEQDILLSTVTTVELIGGYAAAERKIACFGESYGAEPPCVWLKIEPRQQKFADKLTHRDFLGSLRTWDQARASRRYNSIRKLRIPLLSRKYFGVHY